MTKTAAQSGIVIGRKFDSAQLGIVIRRKPDSTQSVNYKKKAGFGTGERESGYGINDDTEAEGRGRLWE